MYKYFLWPGPGLGTRSRLAQFEARNYWAASPRRCCDMRCVPFSSSQEKSEGNWLATRRVVR